jgi:hypothetical protein
MRRTFGAGVLKDAKIVKTVGQIAAVFMLRDDLQAERIAPELKGSLQIGSTNAHVNKFRAHEQSLLKAGRRPIDSGRIVRAGDNSCNSLTLASDACVIFVLAHP